MFKPFKAPSNNHQGFGQGDGAEHVTVKEFIDGVNEHFKRLFGMGGSEPTVDAGEGMSAAMTADALDEAHKSIEELEHGLANAQMRLDALSDIVGKLAVGSNPIVGTVAAAGSMSGENNAEPQAPAPDGKPATGLTPEPTTHIAPLTPDPAGVKSEQA